MPSCKWISSLILPSCWGPVNTFTAGMHFRPPRTVCILRKLPIFTPLGNGTAVAKHGRERRQWLSSWLEYLFPYCSYYLDVSCFPKQLSICVEDASLFIIASRTNLIQVFGANIGWLRAIGHVVQINQSQRGSQMMIRPRQEYQDGGPGFVPLGCQ